MHLSLLTVHAHCRAAKQLERKYNSKSGHLKWVTVLLDPRLMNCGLGLKIAGEDLGKEQERKEERKKETLALPPILCPLLT